MLVLANDRIHCSVCEYTHDACDLLNVTTHRNDTVMVDLCDNYIGDCPTCQELLYIEDVV